VRFAIVFLLAVAGCMVTLPNDPTISADLAWDLALQVVQLRTARDITPDDKQPKPGDKCKPCNGTGKLPTDGRVVVPCGACDGTGRTK